MSARPPYDALLKAEAERERRQTRVNAIMDAPEAQGRQLLAFGLALRLDLDAPTARALLATAPDDLDTPDEVRAWLDAAAPDPATATRH